MGIASPIGNKKVLIMIIIMKKIIILAALVLSVVALAGCSHFGGSENTPSPSLNQERTVESNVVNIEKFKFNPETLIVKKDTAVTWVNNDSAPHQIKSALFNSDLLSKGQSFSFSFNEVGVFDYSCSIHPSMLGKIIVQ